MSATLLHGDCLELMKSLPDKSVDLFICDLPYGILTTVSKSGEARKTEGCAWDIKIDLDALWTQIERLMKNDHTPIIHFCNTKFGVELINSKPDWYRYDLVWNKIVGVGFLNANKMPLRCHENIYIFAKKGANYNRVDIVGDFPDTNSKRIKSIGAVGGVYGTYGQEGHQPPSNEGRRCVKSVVEVSNIARPKGNHPTQKPDALYEWLIARYSKEGDRIVDPTAGSFAAIFTAERMGRHGIGMEMNDAFFTKAMKKKSQCETNGSSSEGSSVSSTEKEV